MNTQFETLSAIIGEQQKEHENEPEFMIGEQLKDIATNEPENIDLLINDLQTEGMKLSDAAKKLQEYADQNHKSAKCFCITPVVAEGILRKFYGLSEPKKNEPTEPEQDNFIDLTSFL